MKQFKFFTTEQEAQAYISSHHYDADEPYWCRGSSVWGLA